MNYGIDKDAFLKTLNTALKTVLLKPGKDPLECGNYRAISLINVDIKLHVKILAARLKKLLGKLIHSDQTGLIKGRLSSDNIR